METAVGLLFLLLLVALVLLGLQRINNTLQEILRLLQAAKVTQEEGNEQRHLGMTYLYSMATREAGGAPAPPSAPATSPE
jgi:Sec-independent protein translocase protein TatA